jgi:hypothetical protein
MAAIFFVSRNAGYKYLINGTILLAAWQGIYNKVCKGVYPAGKALEGFRVRARSPL